MKTATLLLEIGTEEIPSRFMPETLTSIKNKAWELLSDKRISCQDVNAYGTPRRIALLFSGLAMQQEDEITQYRGPKWSQAFDANGNPTKAALGFAKSKGIDFEILKPGEVNGVEYAFVEISEKGQKTETLLPDLMTELIQSLIFPKSMYWDDPNFRFARPIRWILCLLDDRIIPFKVGNISSNRMTRGHRFMGARKIEISHVNVYFEKLYDNYVVVDQDKRREKMLAGISTLEKEISGVADKREDLIQENLYLVEYPVPFFGSFDKDFLVLPEEVLTTTMIHHQKYFPVRDDQGKLLPYFVGVSNNRSTNMNIVREGNERVLRARLSDAAFFWKEDLKTPLSSKVKALQNVIYQEKLGTVYDKVQHIRKISQWIVKHLGLDELEKTVDRAALLAKADLVSSMVYEFPELQGVMGREYARENGETQEVAQAISDQYLPGFSGDKLPSTMAGALIGIAERLYTITSCFSADLQVSGSQDPYGLRRAARCLNEIIWGKGLDIDMNELFLFASRAIEAKEGVFDQSREFFNQRLFMQLKEKGYSHELVSLGLSVISERPFQVARFLDTFREVMNETWFLQLATSAVRVRNILSKAEGPRVMLDKNLFRSPAEKELDQEIDRIVPVVGSSLAQYDWKGLAYQLSLLSPAITRFFDEVLVMDNDPDIRENRLALLDKCNQLFLMIGDLGNLNL